MTDLSVVCKIWEYRVIHMSCNLNCSINLLMYCRIDRRNIPVSTWSIIQATGNV
jgi:hypothetical protein